MITSPAGSTSTTRVRVEDILRERKESGRARFQCLESKRSYEQSGGCGGGYRAGGQSAKGQIERVAVLKRIVESVEACVVGE